MPTAKQKEAAAQVMEHLCEHDWHGYAQDARWGDGEGKCDVDTVIGTVQVEQGDRDCSSGVVDCYNAVGIDTGGATWSGNYYECLMSTGNFRAHRMSDGYNCDDGYVAQRGDCYLAHNGNSKHVAMCLSSDPDLLGEFSGNSFGGITGDLVGDQTGYESWIHDFYGGNWDWCFEVIVDDDGEPQRDERRHEVCVWPSHGRKNQRWKLVKQKGGLYAIKNVADGYYLDVAGADDSDGADVILWSEYHGGKNQLWKFVPIGKTRTYKIVSAMDGKRVLDVVGESTEDGASLCIWPDKGESTGNQVWAVLRNRDGSCTIINNANGAKLVLDACGQA